MFFLPLVYNFSRCWTDVIAPSTDNLLTRDFMFEAVPNSSASILLTLEIWSFGGIIREIMLVPFLKSEKSEYKNNSLTVQDLLRESLYDTQSRSDGAATSLILDTAVAPATPSSILQTS